MMGIFYDAHPADGTVQFYHESIDGPRKLPTWKSPVDREAGKRPVMVDNPSCRIPASAIEISLERFEELMAAQLGGAQIILTKSGKPVAVPRVRDPEEHRAARRRRRDQLLASSDWTQLPDSPLGEADKADWRDYREALRNLDMDASDWPLAPEGEEEE